MAKGIGIVKRKQGSLNKARAWSFSLYQHQTSSVFSRETPSSLIFKTKQREEYKNICEKSVRCLQKHVFRIFEEYLHTDLYIIHDSQVLQTNSCIFETRLPRLYNVLKNKYFTDNTSPIKCYLNIPEVYHRITGFVRLLYCNLDLSKQEQRLIEFITLIENNKSSSIDGSDLNSSRETSDAVDLSPSVSDMADSGLETGSVSLHENTESENSATDVEESHVTDYVSTDDDFIRVSFSGDVERSNKNNTNHRNEWCDPDDPAIKHEDPKISILSDHGRSDSDGDANISNKPRHDFSSPLPCDSAIENSKSCSDIDDVTRYENDVLNDPFYESDSNDNEQSSSFVPTGSFEFIETANLSPRREELEDKNSLGKIRSIIADNLGTNSDNHQEKNHSGITNNYYFIDASSLNDENEISCVKKSDSLTASSLPPFLDTSSSHAPNCSAVSESTKEKLLSRKSSSLEGRESTAEFERELKLGEYLTPVVELKKVKRVDSVPEDSNKAVEKESLVVEIKEADSGESNHPSPCIDNNKRAQHESKKSVADADGADNCHQDEANSIQQSLVRCNTFELESGDESLSHLRQEHERRQGNLVFKNSIQQYSGHRVDNDLTFNIKNYPSMPYFSGMMSDGDSRDEKNYSEASTKGYSLSRSLGNPSTVFSNDLKQVDEQNGIFPITKSASDKFLAGGSELEDDSAADCNSLPLNLDLSAPLHQQNSRSVKRTKRDEMTPIVSGGVSTVDYSKPTDSPTVRRKTESTPIVSGGSVLTNYSGERAKPAKMSSSMTTWVVDMSDCKNASETSTTIAASMSQSYSFTDCTSKNNCRIKSADKQSSLGYFVNLKDINDPKSLVSYGKDVEVNKEANKQSCEFFVDISKPENNNLKCCELNGVKSIHDKIFSMFIDLNEPGGDESDVKEKRQSRFKNRWTSSGKNSGSDSSSNEAANRGKEKKPSVFMFIESDSPVVRRRTLSTSRNSSVTQRHSWNTDKTPPSQNNGHLAFYREHKRAHSVSIDGTSRCDQSSLSQGEKDQKKKSIMMGQLSKSATFQETVPKNTAFDSVNRDTPPNSHVELLNDVSCDNSINAKLLEDDQSELSAWEKTTTTTTTTTDSISGHRKSETFDISSGSVSGHSPGSDNQDFELEDYRSRATFKERRGRLETNNKKASKILETHKSLTETIKKIECEFDKPEYGTMETSCEDMPSDSQPKPNTGNIGDIKDSKAPGPSSTSASSCFVRLSDLDKTPAKKNSTDQEDVEDPLASRSLPCRMSSSIPEMSWVESKLAVNRASGPCQVKTLSTRKFTSIMSTSLPAKHKSPIEEFGNECENDVIISESDLSSMQSSMGRSGADVSTEETETSSFTNAKPHNRLGEDLLRMFLEEINPDVTIDVGGRRIRAHKCILSSRCQYFAAILSGGWIENAGNVISLQGYSYSSVHFALCHIYSGESNIPDSISIVELATLADMLCLEGLKEVIGYTIKVKYCHLFHKPCQLCAVGVLECMPLAAAYGLDEIYRKSLRWITRHFVRIWPCKAFAALPRELMDKCYHQHIVHMSADNILQTIMDCDKLLATLPNVRWAEPVFRMVSNLLEAALKFLSDNFSSVLSNDSFQALGRELTWNISRLEDNVLSAADRLPPDQACKSYAKLHKMLMAVQSDGGEEVQKQQWGPLFVDFLKKIQARVEKCLVKDAPRAARTTTWLKMDLELRRRIQELACLVILPHEALKRPTRHSQVTQESKTSTSRNTVASRNLDLKKVKMTFTEQNNKTSTKSPTVQAIKKILPKPKSDPLERKMPEVKTLASDSGVRPKSWPNKLEVKSRYLEPRNKSLPKETTQQQSLPPERVSVQQRRKIMISSSDSSRTSSPAMKRAVDKKPITKLKIAAKKDVKALSSDSLADSSVAKSTPKRDNASKSCGITRPESPSLQSKDQDIALSIDSLAESKKKPLVVKKTGNKMDTSMSTDSLMTEITTPKSVVSNKVSPTLGRPTAKSLAMERAKKSSPPVNHKSPLTVARRTVRSVESSTAASRNRAAAITAYHGSPNLRRSLVDAAKTPDSAAAAPNKLINGVAKPNLRQSLPSTSTPPAVKKDRKDTNPSSSESPSKRSPKSSSGVNRPNRVAPKKNTIKATDEVKKLKCANGDGPKQLTVGSRSGTFLKDEPTILKKSDMKTTQVTS